MDAPRSDGLLLVIDTSGPLCAAGLFDGRAELSRIVLDIGRDHAERVIGACEDALRDAGARWHDVARIAVTVGPGSFTGVRAGVTAARGLALSLGVPALGVTTLEAMRGPGSTPYAVALDARRGQLYAQGFDARGAPLGPPMIDAPGGLVARLPGTIRHIIRHVVGSGAPALVGAMRSAGHEAAVPERDGRPMTDAQPDIAAVAARAMADGNGRTPPVPLYLRGTDAKLPGGIDTGARAATPVPGSRDSV